MISLGTCFLINFIVIGVSIYIDISNQKKNRKLYRIAYIDPITTLGNEAYFKENGTNFLKTVQKNRYIVALDINRFKVLNKLYGYDFCNEILK